MKNLSNKLQNNIFSDIVFVLAAVPNRLSRDRIIFSENHISHILCLVTSRKAGQQVAFVQGGRGGVDEGTFSFLENLRPP